ncbi:MAG: hypothetical protein UU65_C0002G0205 [candidate division CPR2 bacterium GW2011_GWC1_41_48]|uniref:Putative membrane protein insertion efficiency factor n=1 Tax=candidate division CPR2 bacterium GW2011_GWC1_41_48 TaxID=1618344 RepID=A0A0G0WBI3_UNCC2|nr:MAG: hypothetical protein UT47_C0002G0099 [candidate division CPR2 bacterium GW2011_GWC2_39_35]KKR27968.1 MAG: hypothetical protein UT60_C0031G0019 [candidate division CPR2 bacterium GW2011_GWD2_39_7]KKS09427.1 MAG: hypothetical protein UU65_C0002G0205 [candidate division CPR2 bacterium GW2011_GWC1_41_48]OGB72076.1 MAG: membrane protein insertion efficiency factor YidD [candidate division CPR2 bacterium GWD2_39_7]
MKKIAVSLIKIYQKTISPDHGLVKGVFPHGVCRFTPTCSAYTLEAIEKYGFIKGSAMGSRRILRCNPWSKGGDDPVK